MALDPRVSGLFDRAANAESLGGLLKMGFGGFVLSIFAGLVSGVLSLTDLVVRPINAFGLAIVDLIDATFGGGASILLAGVESSVVALLGPWAIGPFTFPFALGIVLLSLAMIAIYREQEFTGNIIAGLPIDIPFFGNDEDTD